MSASIEREPIEATIAELKPRMKNISITFKMLEIGEPREVTSRDDGSTHRVADAVVGDSTGTVTVPLWDDSIDTLEVGSTYRLTNGYTGLFRNNLRLNIGKYGEIAEAEEAIEEVNTDNDMSLAEHEDYRRRPRRSSYGSGGYGGGRDYGSSDSRGYGGRRDRRDRGYGGRRRR